MSGAFKEEEDGRVAGVHERNKREEIREKLRPDHFGS